MVRLTDHGRRITTQYNNNSNLSEALCKEIHFQKIQVSHFLFCTPSHRVNSSLIVDYTGVLFYCYMLDASICHFRVSGLFCRVILFLMENPVSKQCRS